jgi:hypothetical protein
VWSKNGTWSIVLRDTAHEDEGQGQWVRQGFALLRLVACTADRMGLVLLIQSLGRAFRGMARGVLPLLDSKAVRPWALCAMNALTQKNLQALKQQLPPLLQVGDEQLLRSLAPEPPLATVCAPLPSVAKPPPGGNSMSSAQRGACRRKWLRTCPAVGQVCARCRRQGPTG